MRIYPLLFNALFRKMDPEQAHHLGFGAIRRAGAAPGGLAALRAAPGHARRVIGAALATGGTVLILRYVATTVLRDAKDVELLVVPVSVTAAAALAWAWERGADG